jgi:aspartyl/asparaginyl beta-hydroxylase (cupin superfamily)
MSFADNMEQALRVKFGSDQIERVITAWTRMRRGETFELDHPGQGLQQAASYMPGLTAKAWHDTTDAALFPWAAALEQHAAEITAELQEVMAREDVYEVGTNVWTPAAREEALDYGPDWRTLVLQDREWDPVNSNLFPRTTKIVKDAMDTSCEVFFARQAPHTGIKPHTDSCNFIMTAHLGLDVPPANCWMQVGNSKKEWRNSELLIFDTSFVHSTGGYACVYMCI